MEEWERGYRRRMLDFIHAPSHVDLYTVEISSQYEEGYHYSEGTSADTFIETVIRYADPETGKSVIRYMDGEQIVHFLRTLG